MRRGALTQAARREIDALVGGDVEEVDLALAAVDHHHQLVAAGRDVGERVALAAGDDARRLAAQPVVAPGALAGRRR